MESKNHTFKMEKFIPKEAIKKEKKEGLWKYFNINGDIDTTYYIE